jgi:hypothetical protein
MGQNKAYDLKRGRIALVNRSTGDMRCLKCGALWRATFGAGGRYRRGSWACHTCGASSEGVRTR